MGIKCQKCGNIVAGTGGLHLASCQKCGNDDIMQFIRVEEKIDTSKMQDYEIWLKSL